jgi:hypothetical protein
MAKVSMHLGFTFRVGELSTNQYGRIDLSIDQIDTELPVDEQLAEASYTADQVWDVLQTKVDSQLENILENNE